MKEIILDTETTGLSTKEGHRIVEIGCIELDNLVPTKNRFHCYLNPDRKVSEKAFKVHGYTDEFLSKQKRFDQIVDEFLNFIKGKKADIAVIDATTFHLAPTENPYSMLAYSCRATDVRHVLTDGEFRVRDNRLVGGNIQKITEAARYQSSIPQKRLVGTAN